MNVAALIVYIVVTSILVAIVAGQERRIRRLEHQRDRARRTANILAGRDR